MNDSGKVFHDLQTFEQASTAFALNSSLLQLDRGAPTIHHDGIHFDDLILRRLRISHGMIDGFTMRNGWTTFVFCPPVEGMAVWNGVQARANAIGIVRSGVDHEVLMAADWATIEIDVVDSLVRAEGLLPESVFACAMTPEQGQLRMSTGAASLARERFLALLDSSAARSTAAGSNEHGALLRRAILDCLANAIEHCCKDELLPMRRSSPHIHGLVRRARVMLDDQICSNPSIESVAAEVGVSCRSLQRGFVRVLGVSPKHYFLARKLDAARRSLQGSGGEVGEVAHEFGFVSASRFAEQFRRYYGRPPSQERQYLKL